MELFEFLMILLSIIIGLGLAEILTGVAKLLREGRQAEFNWVHGTVAAIIFVVLLQVFWESWGLRAIDTWTFPSMLLMLSTPVLLFLIAHILFPDKGQHADLGEYYFQRSRLIWSLATLTVVVSVLFRPIAFDMPLLVRDNLSSAPSLVACVLLATVSSRQFHYVMVPLVLLTVLVDTLAINYFIR